MDPHPGPRGSRHAGLDFRACDAAHVFSPSRSPRRRPPGQPAREAGDLRGGILHYLRVDLDQLGGVLYSLARGGDYAEVARVDAAGLVVLNQPFTATLDLPALARDPLAALQHPDPGPRPGI